MNMDHDFDCPDTVQDTIGYLISDINTFKNDVESRLEEMSERNSHVGAAVSQIMHNTGEIHFGLFVISILLSLILWRVW